MPKSKKKLESQTIVEYLVMLVAVLAIIVAFIGPSGLFRKAQQKTWLNSVAMMECTSNRIIFGNDHCSGGYVPSSDAGFLPPGNAISGTAGGASSGGGGGDSGGSSSGGGGGDSGGGAYSWDCNIGPCDVDCGSGTRECVCVNTTSGTTTLDAFCMSGAGPKPAPVSCDSGTTCAWCGNGIVDAGEECDKTAFGGKTCVSEGFSGGPLGCLPFSCAIDTSGCWECGNGRQDPNELCDGIDVNCLDGVGYAGIKSCSGNCSSFGPCTTFFYCGDGAHEGPEACDPGEIESGNQNPLFCGPEACDQSAGTLPDCIHLGTGYCGRSICRSDCTADPNVCNLSASCGDGILQGPAVCTLPCSTAACGPEQCDGFNFGGRTCASFGFNGGNLSCNGSCQISTAGCF